MTRPKPWTAEALLELGRGYQSACLLAAAADLDLFTALAPKSQPAQSLAKVLRADPRALTILLDALVALGLLTKRGARYAVPPAVAAALTPEGAHSVLAMTQHQANCLRRWSQLAWTVQHGRPAPCQPSVRGPEGDAASFIGAMHDISGPIADEVLRPLQSLPWSHLLDVGGASGTWTLAFLRARPAATATLFDLPHVIPMAAQRLAAEGVSERVTLATGDFTRDPLPKGADLAWVSAIVHQNSRLQNRRLLASVFRALTPGGHVAIRDIVMERDHTRPVAGALFAVNMLSATEGGGTFTFAELKEDLAAAGFTAARQVRRDEGMHSIVVARKPAPARGR